MTSEPGRTRRPFTGAESLTSGLLLVGAVVALAQIGTQIEVVGFDEVGPTARTVPRLALGILVFAVASRLVLNRHRNEHPIGPLGDLSRVLAVAMATLAAILLMPSLGFVPGAALVGIITAVAFGERRWVLALILNVGLAALVGYGARYGLKIPLP